MKVNFKILIVTILLGCFAALLIGDFSSKQQKEREIKVSNGIATIVSNAGRKGYAKGSKTIVVNGVRFICKATGPVNAETCLDENAISKITDKHVRAFWYSRRGAFFANGGTQLLRIEDASGNNFIVPENFTNREPDWGGAALMIFLGFAIGLFLSRKSPTTEAKDA